MSDAFAYEVVANARAASRVAAKYVMFPYEMNVYLYERGRLLGADLARHVNATRL